MRGRRWVHLLIVALVVALGWHFRYSLTRTWGLEFPRYVERFMIVAEPIEVDVTRGLTKERYAYRLAPGTYLPVLANREGTFFLAPPKGFYEVQSTRREGLGVGGIYLAAGEGGMMHVWEYPLENEKRSPSSPSAARPLSAEEDPPEREKFLDPDWYANKGFSLTGRPLVDSDFPVPEGAVEMVER